MAKVLKAIDLGTEASSDLESTLHGTFGGEATFIDGREAVVVKVAGLDVSVERHLRHGLSEIICIGIGGWHKC